MSNTPTQAYRALLKKGHLRPDPAQEALLPSLERLHDELKGYEPPQRIQAAIRAFLPDRFQKPYPKGLYLWGDVGRGKSMLMDVFYQTAPIEKKQRIHFHAFIRDMHAKVHAWRQAQRAEGEELNDPILPLARRIRDETALLCLDEFEVQDVADAMLLARLFTLLIKRGVVLVMTSNRPPEKHYEHGQQRERYLRFVRHLKEHIEVHHLQSPVDYRRIPEKMNGDRGSGIGKSFFLPRTPNPESRFLYPLTPTNQSRFDTLFAEATDDLPAMSLDVRLQGRSITFPHAVGDTVMLDFDAVCRVDLGANDYLAIAENFVAVFIRNIPVIPKEERNTARRFILLMDALYDAGTTVYCLADAHPDDLFPIGPAFEGVLRCQSRLMELEVALE